MSFSSRDQSWKAKEQGEEAVYARKKEQEQLAAMHEEQQKEAAIASAARDKDFEGGFGGQEDLEDRYATTSGEH